MAIAFNTLTETAYQTLRYTLIKQVEESGNVSLTPYVDSVGIPTIGFGFNIGANAQAILKGLGSERPENTAEQIYVNRIAAIGNTTYQQTAEGKLKLQADLNKVMADRAKDPNITGVKRSTFSFVNESEIKSVFNALSEKYEDTILRWQNQNGLSNIPFSAERAVIFSFAYGSRNLLGAGLASAIRDNNRAEAWYEIRYNSNGDNQHAKRRYLEAEIFGLYRNGTGPANKDEAYNVYQMFTAQRSDILTYENSYESQISQANLELAEAQLTQYHVNILSDELKSAATLLSNVYGQGRIFDSLSIQAASSELKNLTGDKNSSNTNDLLLGDNTHNNLNGGAGSDVLAGGLGNDNLNGGAGNDKLIGGTGFDSYIISGNDTVIDSDGKGSIQTDTGIFIRSDGSEGELAINDEIINWKLVA